jgi:hypothetical protein
MKGALSARQPLASPTPVHTHSLTHSFTTYTPTHSLTHSPLSRHSTCHPPQLSSAQSCWTSSTATATARTSTSTRARARARHKPRHSSAGAMRRPSVRCARWPCRRCCSTGGPGAARSQCCTCGAAGAGPSQR